MLPKTDVFCIVAAMKKTLFCIAMATVLCGAAEPAAPAKPTLFKRLGGIYPIASVVDDFVDRLYSDKVITANPVVKADFERSGKAGLKFHLTAMICEAAGGPCKYSGRSMKESHDGMNIGEAEWDAAVKDLKAALADFDVPDQEQSELIAVVASTKPDIVTAKTKK